MTRENPRSWPTSEMTGKRPCEKCGADLPPPIMTDRGGDERGPAWVHDRSDTGGGVWYVRCPNCGHHDYFDLGDDMDVRTS